MRRTWVSASLVTTLRSMPSLRGIGGEKAMVTSLTGLPRMPATIALKPRALRPEMPARSLRDIDRDQLLVGWLPDLVLMDYHLDQTSGLDAVEWLRHNVGGHLPAALVTADRTTAVRTLAEERGIAVVTKPVKPAALRAAISGLAAQRPMRSR